MHQEENTMDQFDDVRQVKQNVFFYFLGYQQPISPTLQINQHKTSAILFCIKYEFCIKQ